MKEGFKIKGVLNIKIQDKEGNVKSDDTYENLIVNSGKAEVINLIGNVVSPTPFTFLGTGTGSNAPASGDIALQAENNSLGFTRSAATVSRTTTNFTNDTLQLTKTRTAGGSVTVSEVGVFNAVASGTLLGRKVVGPYALSNTDQFVLTYQITII